MYNITFPRNNLYSQRNIKYKPSFRSSDNCSDKLSSHYKDYDPNEVHFSIFDDSISENSKICNYLRGDILNNSGAGHLYEKSLVTNSLSELVDNHHELPHNSQSGESFVNYLDKCKILDIAKSEKIDTIIDLNGFTSLKEACKMNGFNYIPYPTVMGNYWESSVFQNHDELIKKEERRLSTQGLTKIEFDQSITKYKEQLANEQHIFMDEFKKIVTALRRGHCYIACMYGDIRTEGMLKLISNIDIDNWGTTKFPVTGLKEKELYRNFVKNFTKQDLEFFAIDAEKLRIIAKAFK